jgi:hypothetical protein
VSIPARRTGSADLIRGAPPQTFGMKNVRAPTLAPAPPG